MTSIEAHKDRHAPRGLGMSGRVGVALIVLALLTGIPAAVKTVMSFVDTVMSPAIAVPGEKRLDLPRGDFMVYERTGTDRGNGGFSFRTDGTPTLDPSDVTVVSPDGTPLDTRAPGSGNETITRGSAVYTGAVRFTTPQPGTYEVRVFGGDAGEVLVARTLGDSFRAVAGWFALALVAGLGFVAGTVMLAVDLFRRYKAKNAPAVPPPAAGPPPGHTPAAPPAGWYPDPTNPGRHRYWTGSAWADYPSW